MARADWLAKLRISGAIYLRATREKMASRVHPSQVKKSSKLIVWGVYYLTVLVYTRTTIHLSVGGYRVDIHLAVSRLGKCPPLATSTSVNSC